MDAFTPISNFWSVRKRNYLKHRDRNLVRIPANISDGQIRNDQVTALTHKNIFHSFRMVYQQLHESKW